jgi:hypothetical protein
LPPSERTRPDVAQAAVREAGHRLEPQLNSLLDAIADVETGGWDTDWVRLPKRHATALLVDITEDLVGPGTAEGAASRAELLGSELALRLWLDPSPAEEAFRAAAERLIPTLQVYRASLQVLGTLGPAS